MLRSATWANDSESGIGGRLDRKVEYVKYPALLPFFVIFITCGARHIVQNARRTQLSGAIRMGAQAGYLPYIRFSQSVDFVLRRVQGRFRVDH